MFIFSITNLVLPTDSRIASFTRTVALSAIDCSQCCSFSTKKKTRPLVNFAFGFLCKNNIDINVNQSAYYDSESVQCRI